MSADANRICAATNLVFDEIDYIDESVSNCSTDISSSTSSSCLIENNDAITSNDEKKQVLLLLSSGKQSNSGVSKFAVQTRNKANKQSQFSRSSLHKLMANNSIQMQVSNQVNTSKKNGTKIAQMQILVNDQHNDTQQFVVLSKNNKKRQIKFCKKHDQQNSNKNNQQMREEIKQSKISHICNLAALQLQVMPTGLPLSSLVQLDLSQNHLCEIDQNVFAGRCGQFLRKVLLQSNHLRCIPSTLLRLSRLQQLNLSHNYLHQLPFTTLRKQRNRCLLPALISINVEFNQINKFPIELFQCCSRLQILRISQNYEMLQTLLPFDQLQSCKHARQYFQQHHTQAVTQKLVSQLQQLQQVQYQNQQLCQQNKYTNQNNKQRDRRLCLTIDNHPSLLEQMTNQRWACMLPWLHVELHKIYPDKLMENLFIGSLRTAQTGEVYRNLNIEYVLTAGRDLKVSVLPYMKHLILPLNDFPEQNPLPLFEQAIDFINSARFAHKGVLVHCFAGLSRSAVIAAAYLMKQQHMRCDDALRAIRLVRPAIRPNDGFVKALRRFEQKIFQLS